ncbi:MAG: site-2 protease family protein [Candidatus Methanomethylophilus sp.]|nr:site-2 protease family protein [Methanomethylophilus sp.]
MFRNTNFVTAYFKYYLGDLWAAGMFGMMAVIVILSFFIHELGHKFTAQRMGLWSEYRMFPMGLIVAVVMSMFGFLFAAPGVVYIRGYVDPEQDGKISMAGPATNIVLALIGLALAMALNGQPLMVPFYLLFILNASLALFNLLPFGILDGAKILRWNSSVWTLMIIVAGVLFGLRMFGILPTFEYTLG